MSTPGTEATTSSVRSALTTALRRLADYVENHEHAEHLAARLWCYDRDEDLTAETGYDVIDQTLGNVLSVMLRSNGDPESVLDDHGLLVDLAPMLETAAR